MPKTMLKVSFLENKELAIEPILDLYAANKWSAANKPDKLYQALLHSHTLVTAWENNRLIGLGNAISDGYLVVYYPHLLVHPDYQGKGIGKMIVRKMLEKYKGFHMQMLTADEKAIDFYKKLGFVKAGKTVPMWIYQGEEH